MLEERKVRNRQLKKSKQALNKGIEIRLENLTEEVNEINKKYVEEIIEMKQKLSRHAKKNATKMQIATMSRYRQKGEKCTKYWFNLNKSKSDDNVIIVLKDENDKITRDTRKMGEIAVKHHEKLQTKPLMDENRKVAIEKMESLIEGKTINNAQKLMLAQKTSKLEIETALRNTANGTSPGIDGIPYELYKEIVKKDSKEKDIDIIGILQQVINNIEERGVEKMSTDSIKENEFTDGLMFLLFKKKDKCKIENYRPITLLNTDYKLYTKTIARKLSEVAPTIVHEDQAGFIPKRSLYDHTRTTQMVIEYCEVMEEDGCIVALDQEKAYDKIDHDYLWMILKKFGFPENFIEKIKELYKDTGKAIMINGIVTRKYKVGRGVHQGDPMSCILYDLAIEPLAEALRKSNLKGIQIKENIDKLLVNLFADDTLVYLGKDDSIITLNNTLDIFCRASTAKFNIDKTEILPVGKKEFRQKMIQERKMGQNNIPDNIKIVKYGESMRSLGAWVGNAKNDSLQWEKIIKAQEKTIDMWEKLNLTTKGKELVLKSLVQSKAVFLATVNGMPKDIEKKIERMYHSFLWKGKQRGLMKWNQAIVKRSEGGLGIPNIKSRIEAIEIMWVKKWLNTEEKRPKWAFLMDKIINKSIAKQPMIDQESRLNWLIQSWHESEAKDVKLSDNIRRMLKVARKYNISPLAPKYDNKAKRNQPLWHNIMMKEENYQWNKKSARCLRKKHKIETIGDLIDWNDTKECSQACNKMSERLVSMIPDIVNPLKETPQKIKLMKLDLTPRRIERNEQNKDSQIFNPDITARENWQEAIRLFLKKKGPKTRRTKQTDIIKTPTYRNEPVEEKLNALITLKTKDTNRPKEKTTIIIRTSDMTDGIKVKHFVITGEDQSKDKARAAALIWVLKQAGDKKMRILTDDTRLIEWVGHKLNKAEDDNWLGVENIDIWKMVLRKLRRRGNTTKIKRIEKDSLLQEKIDNIKEQINSDEDIEELEVRIGRENSYNRDGAKLQSMTQKKAYELILRETTENPGGLKTITNLEKIKEQMAEHNKKITDKEIWKSLTRIYSPQTTDFIWKIIHGRLKCGSFFRFIPGWQDKEFCPCGASESIEHILLLCNESGQEELWKIVKEKWEMETRLKLGTITMGMIMGIGCYEVEKSHKIQNRQATDLLRKLIVLTAWVIWKDRNERIFSEKPWNSRKMKIRWLKEIRKEMKIDLWGNEQGKQRIDRINMWTTNGTFADIIEKEKKTSIKLKLNLEATLG